MNKILKFLLSDLGIATLFMIATVTVASVNIYSHNYVIVNAGAKPIFDVRVNGTLTPINVPYGTNVTLDLDISVLPTGYTIVSYYYNTTPIPALQLIKTTSTPPYTMLWCPASDSHLDGIEVYVYAVLT